MYMRALIYYSFSLSSVSTFSLLPVEERSPPFLSLKKGEKKEKKRMKLTLRDVTTDRVGGFSFLFGGALAAGQNGNKASTEPTHLT